ncbi:hypothetical protein SAMN05421858_1357 [Haladaptatus litoreus]|uniref:Uncharacterized protein n=1 Tax=Haladaptatus litoreus TaxID=553468 RepID=A0A1N6Y160_9EURY|nr:hypothetical protein [Haladaptatus litoreus]SIR08362.1 hypothetical protein SAMN05421858_1357 [Haladaptatus litoreus]
MSLWLDVARVATALNVLLLLGLSYVWLRNYMQFRSKHTLGLSVFALLLLGENAVALYVYSWDELLSVWFATAVPPEAWHAMLALHILEFFALSFLLWATWD